MITVIREYDWYLVYVNCELDSMWSSAELADYRAAELAFARAKAV
jgi:hypothetical protein